MNRLLNKIDRILPVVALAFLLVFQPAIHRINSNAVPMPDGYNQFLWRIALCTQAGDLESEGNQSDCSLCSLDITPPINSLYAALSSYRLEAILFSYEGRTSRDEFDYSMAARAPPYL